MLNLLAKEGWTIGLESTLARVHTEWHGDCTRGQVYLQRLEGMRLLAACFLESICGHTLEFSK